MKQLLNLVVVFFTKIGRLSKKAYHLIHSWKLLVDGKVSDYGGKHPRCLILIGGVVKLFKLLSIVAIFGLWRKGLVAIGRGSEAGWWVYSHQRVIAPLWWLFGVTLLCFFVYYNRITWKGRVLFFSLILGCVGCSLNDSASLFWIFVGMVFITIAVYQKKPLRRIFVRMVIITIAVYQRKPLRRH